MTTTCIDALKRQLADLIGAGADYAEVLRTSQRLDRFIVRQQRQLLRKGAKK